MDPGGSILKKESDGKRWRITLPKTGFYDLVLLARQPNAAYTFTGKIR
jgi:hypothetical protein